MELAALQQRIDELQRQCDRDGAELREQLRTIGTSDPALAERHIQNRLRIVALGQQMTAAQGRARRHHSATRS